jgi:hypothetical protein
VIAYLIVTSLINMSLGYALAVYLGRTRLHAADAAPTLLPESLQQVWRAEQPIEQSAPTATTEAKSTTGPDERRTDVRSAPWRGEDDDVTQESAQAGDGLSASDAPMMEKDLLAGIEEFRLQLAKIKGHAEGEPLAADLAAAVGSES